MAVDFQGTGSMEIRDSGGVVRTVEDMQIRDDLGVVRDIDTFWINEGPSGPSAVWESVTFGYSTLTITGAETSVDLAPYIPGGGSPFLLKVAVAAGATVLPAYAEKAIYSSVAFPANSHIRFIINGQVHAVNGNGGYGGSRLFDPLLLLGEVGQVGADCIDMPCDADLTMGTNGELWSGGGGGGGGSIGRDDSTHDYFGAGGGGGRNPGPGGIGNGGMDGVGGGTAGEYGTAAGGAGWVKNIGEFGGNGGACNGFGLDGGYGGAGGWGGDGFFGGTLGGLAGYAVKPNTFILTHDAGDVGTKIKGRIA